MTRVVDLHPEELIERDARGTLSAPDRARLETHLARCAACRFERQLRADFDEDLEGPVSSSAIERLSLAGAARVEAGSPSPAPSGAAPLSGNGSVPPPARRPRSRAAGTRAVWLLAAAALFAGSVAGATGAGRQAWSRILGAPAAPASAAPGEAAPAPPKARRATRHGAATVESVPERSHEVPSVDVLVAPAPLPAPVMPPARKLVAAPPVAQADTAATLFDQSNVARRHGDYARALALQGDLELHFPHSREAHVSHATTGRLLLDRGDPAAALARFDAYLAGGSGELGEEALVGRATALERLGRGEEAGRAWQALLAAYPETPYAAHARARLGSTSAR